MVFFFGDLCGDLQERKLVTTGRRVRVPDVVKINLLESWSNGVLEDWVKIRNQSFLYIIKTQSEQNPLLQHSITPLFQITL